MTYGSIDEVKRMFEKANVETLSDSDIKSNLEMGDHLIDGFLRGFFTVPFSTPPDLVVDISNLFAASGCIRQKYPSQSKEIINYARSYSKDGWNLLKMLRNGKLNFDPTTNPRLAVLNSSRLDEDPVFDMETTR